MVTNRLRYGGVASTNLSLVILGLEARIHAQNLHINLVLDPRVVARG